MTKPHHIWLEAAKAGDVYILPKQEVEAFRGYAARRGVKIKTWCIKRSGVKQWRVKIL